jgi:transcriptional regulator with XRE-family HTH domain
VERVTEVSDRLRTAREHAGLTIEEISASTKISAGALRAIERGDFAKLPGEFYIRAFLRTYARELGLSPDAVVGEYDASQRPAQALAPDRPEHHPHTVTRRQPAVMRGVALPAPWPRFMALAGNAVVVVTLVVILAVVFVRSHSAARAPEPGAVGTRGDTAAVPAPAPTSAAAAPEVRAERLVMEIQAAAPTWVTGAADGRRVIYRLLAPGERVTVDARDELSFRVGNASAFTYSINGAPGKPVGGPGEVREFQITRDNYRTFRR